jgi:signal transduction histidine kinase
VIAPRRSPRYLAVALLLAMAGFAAVGFFTIRRDVENLRVISQDNTQWAAAQVEIEMLRLRLSLAALAADPSPENYAEMRERFDILWSRVDMDGRVGESLRRHDGTDGPLAGIAGYLAEIDPQVRPIDATDAGLMAEIEATFEGFQVAMREFTQRVLRSDSAAAALVRMRIESSARTTALISVAAVLVSMLSFFLLLRENRRQHQIAQMNRRSAEQALLASRAKSRFLSMMSHELRNPLNGILGPLALLGQSDLASGQQRLVGQAKQSGQSMLQMLSGLLDYGEMQDGRFQLRNEPFRPLALADGVRDSLAAEGAEGIAVQVLPNTPDRVQGDLDRLRQVFVHLMLYMLEGRRPSSGTATVRFGHDGSNLVGEIAVAGGDSIEWKLDLLMGLSEVSPDQVTAEALRPLIARGLIAACQGILTLVGGEDGRRMIRVAVPSRPVKLEQIRVYLETRSTALAAIYQAALRSERVAFVAAGNAGPVDVVLVDSTSVGEVPLMTRLRARFPGALFVSLGLPQTPDFFDDIVETPNDMSRLRTSILGRLAS